MPKLLSAGAVAAGVTASICCFGPLLLAALGLGGGATLLALAPARPYALAAAAIFLAAGFFLAYRRTPDPECPADGACAGRPGRRGQRIALWIAAVIVALAAAFPDYARWLF